MSSDMRGEAPAITEDSDLSLIIKELYKGRVGRNQKTSDFCVGGALCHYFLRYDSQWAKMRKPSFPFSDQLFADLEWIVRDYGSERVNEYYFGDNGGVDNEDGYWDAGDVEDREVEFTDTLEYYADAIVNANDAGEYDDAWVHVDMFLKEFEID